ncbi:UV DNA damage repair endonuclease UvsE [Adhaeribacter sp. BT258]|uniref:UV DNA damage repair endonuclease UvsE n=1 Tax=Adhaeribacter terrigena TaxID=2793070 RepID=A0ABS1C3W7_9BACT|nr:UV DNA damage repair endonuclease UvsE [Adhaeribacter terrigena]MBK0404096.1 UV DNA damage repair endonuclease UvsE [Adhaeribacter terrigena]
MKIGYPCINESLPCTSSSTFRLASFSEERLLETTARNFACLENILEYNVAHNLLFFRMSSDLVPFASHKICTVDWQMHFKSTLEKIGRYIQNHGLRISMHPDQFVVLNSPKPEIVENSVRELVYQCEVMDLMQLESSAKLQIHGGGVYGDKPAAMQRFIETYALLPENVKNRLVIENDDRLYSLQDCLFIHEQTGIPILFDNFHHECLNNGEPMHEALALAAQTWQENDGILMMDYSSQALGERKGKHTDQIVEALFREFLLELRGLDLDIMLEIKNKEVSALKAVSIAREMGLLV